MSHKDALLKAGMNRHFTDTGHGGQTPLNDQTLPVLPQCLKKDLGQTSHVRTCLVCKRFFLCRVSHVFKVSHATISKLYSILLKANTPFHVFPCGMLSENMRKAIRRLLYNPQDINAQPIHSYTYMHLNPCLFVFGVRWV